MKILHVTECYEAGVGKAIDTFTELSPELEHHISFWGMENPHRNRLFGFVFRMPDNPLMRLPHTFNTIRRVRPDIIIAHSSWAGLYTRILPTTIPIYYEPHCYVFEDPKRPTLLRRIYWLIEKILSTRSAATLVLSARERFLAQQLNPSKETIFFPNTNSIGVEHRPQSAESLHRILHSRRQLRGAEPFTVSMSGRLAAQKDPGWFLAVKETLYARGVLSANDVRFRWIGDGSPDDRRRMAAAGGGGDHRLAGCARSAQATVQHGHLPAFCPL